LKDFFKETLNTVISSIILTAFIYFFISTPNEIKGPSMMPNVLNGDLILTNRTKHLLGGTALGKAIGWDYKRGDIVIFKLPGKEAYIKRVMAVGGDEIKIENGYIFVNNKQVIEYYLPDTTVTKAGNFINENPKTVPEDMVIVMGDNRANSLDSRYSDVGFVERRYIIGPAGVTLLPIKRFGLVDKGKLEDSEVQLTDDTNENIKIEII
jgi:signal peptidase I